MPLLLGQPMYRLCASRGPMDIACISITYMICSHTTLAVMLKAKVLLCR